jgi:NAD(P)-dependent dehydrogenase (short-subunit alcohol dehydrogenase family)
MTAYTASKFAIEAIADGLRVEVRQWGIRVVLVEPGSIDTDLWRGAEAQFDTGVAAMTDEHRQLYSGLLTGMRKTVRATAKRAAPVDKVAAAVVKAVTAERPRTRYVVGVDARGQMLLKATLPDRAYDALVARVTGA